MNYLFLVFMQVEGITLDLTDVDGCDISALIEAAGLKEKKAPKEKKVTPVSKFKGSINAAKVF